MNVPKYCAIARLFQNTSWAEIDADYPYVSLSHNGATIINRGIIELLQRF